MAYEAVDGMLTVAQLNRSLFGGVIYTDVAVRRDDGDVRRLGTIMVIGDMKAAMVPGTRGRFYAFNVLGTKGIFGIRQFGRPPRCAFPVRFEVTSLALGLIALLLTAYFVATGSGFAWVSGLTSAVSLVSAAMYARERVSATRLFRTDDRELTPGSEWRSALRV